LWPRLAARRRGKSRSLGSKETPTRTQRRWLKLARSRRDQLCERLPELAHLDEARIGIVMKIALGKCAQPHELNVVRLEESEIARAWLHSE
jgi:hypothetical protein